MADKVQKDSYKKNTKGEGTTKSKPATVIPAKKKHVSTMMGEFVAGSVSKVGKNMKNKNKINP
ncbi:hypothetical protein HanIR_Chr11g0542471 [Helianthus annuus]|nr:hypothetical protein HanIR_Chr11g0542471 [Helianthus annuus]